MSVDAQLMSVPSKTCTTCGRCLLAVSDNFHRQAAGLHGFTSKCKSCKNAEIRSAQQRNPNGTIRTRKRWKEQNYEKYLGLKRDDQRRRRYAKSLESVDDEKWQAMKSLGCLRCGSHEDITQDHVVPLSRSGRNHISNIQPLCRPCNSSKGASVIDYRNSAGISMIDLDEILESDTILV